MTFYSIREDCHFVYGKLYELLGVLNNNRLSFYIKNEKNIDLLREFKFQKKKKVEFVGVLDYLASFNEKESEFVVFPIIISSGYEIVHLGVSVFFKENFASDYKKEKYNYLELYVRTVERANIYNHNTKKCNKNNHGEEEEEGAECEEDEDEEEEEEEEEEVEEEEDIRVNYNVLISLRDLKVYRNKKNIKNTGIRKNEEDGINRIEKNRLYEIHEHDVFFKNSELYKFNYNNNYNNDSGGRMMEMSIDKKEVSIYSNTTHTIKSINEGEYRDIDKKVKNIFEKEEENVDKENMKRKETCHKIEEEITIDINEINKEKIYIKSCDNVINKIGEKKNVDEHIFTENDVKKNIDRNMFEKIENIKKEDIIINKENVDILRIENKIEHNSFHYKYSDEKRKNNTDSCNKYINENYVLDTYKKEESVILSPSRFNSRERNKSMNTSERESKNGIHTNNEIYFTNNGISKYTGNNIVVGISENSNKDMNKHVKQEDSVLFISGYHSSKGNRTYNEDRVINIENINEFLKKEYSEIKQKQEKDEDYDQEYKEILMKVQNDKNSSAYMYCAIYDGHNGENAVNIVQKYLHMNIHFYFLNGSGIINSIKYGFKAMDEKICKGTTKVEEDNHSHYSSGTTACVTLIFKNVLYIGNIGDSRCVLSKNGRAVVLTVDHRASMNKKEQDRIRNSGGTLDDEGYLGGCLGVCRGFGSFDKKTKNKLKGLICDPDVFQIKLTDDDEFLIICCDGIFDVMTSQEAVNTVRMSLIEHTDANSAAENLCNLAYTRKSLDNLSAVVVIFQNPANRKKTDPNENCCLHSTPNGRVRRRIQFAALKNLLNP